MKLDPSERLGHTQINPLAPASADHPQPGTRSRPRIGVNLLYLRPGTISGTGNYAWRILEVLAQRGNLDLVVFCQGASPSVNAAFEGVRFIETGAFRNVISRIAYEQVVLPMRGVSEGIELMWSPAYVSVLWGRFRKVVSVHDLYYRKIPWAIDTWQRAYWRMFIPASARLADAIVAISMNTAQDLLEILPASKDKLHVVHLAPSLNRSYEVRKCRLPVEGSYALVVAHLTRNKNIETVVKAARILQQNGIGCRVCVAGRDSQGLLAKAIKDNSAQDCVVVCGEVSDQVLCDLYENAICLVHASLYEGFGLPALEAQAMGAPLVCSNGGALPEVAGDGAIYFNPRDPEELAQIIGRLTDRPDERRHWRERGAENLRRFSWEKTAEGMERIFNDVLKGNRAPKAL